MTVDYELRFSVGLRVWNEEGRVGVHREHWLIPICVLYRKPKSSPFGVLWWFDGWRNRYMWYFVSILVLGPSVIPKSLNFFFFDPAFVSPFGSRSLVHLVCSTIPLRLQLRKWMNSVCHPNPTSCIVSRHIRHIWLEFQINFPCFLLNCLPGRKWWHHQQIQWS